MKWIGTELDSVPKRKRFLRELDQFPSHSVAAIRRHSVAFRDRCRRRRRAYHFPYAAFWAVLTRFCSSSYSSHIKYPF